LNNPYTAPTAAIDDIEADDTYTPKIFALSGRIGRLRYIAYTWLAQLLFCFVVGIVAAIAIPLFFRGNANGAALGVFMLIIFYVPAIAINLIYTRRRLNDLDQTGWLGLLVLVPFVNILFILYLIFGSGTDGSNRFGPAPSKQSNAALWVILILFFGIVIIGILAAVAIPAYQKYQVKARAVQLEQRQQQQQQQ